MHEESAMQSLFLIPLAAVLMVATHVEAQSRIWRCGNSYTNNEAQAKAAGCKLVEGGNVTVVEGTRVNGNNGVKTVSAPPAAPQKVDSAEQRARDSEARTILEAELKKAEGRHSELLKEWNNGEPEKMGPEHRNHQKYLDRVAELKASIARNENDIAGLKRELGRAAK
jgi:hypothetical protein